MNKRRQNQTRNKKRRTTYKRQTKAPPEFDWSSFIRGVTGALFPPPQPPAWLPILSPELLKKMLMLCHPDKHGNSEVATEVTRWLLEYREANYG